MTDDAITVVEVLRRAQGYLAGRGVESPRLDAELLLADMLVCDRLSLYTGHDRPLTTAETDAYRASIARRATREPVAYILGHKGFRTIELTVGPQVLVPRPETELLVDWGLQLAAAGARVLDWGTGSGAIALALVAERPDLEVTGIDRSEAALAIARSNDPHGCVRWVCSSGFANLQGDAFDLILANPPYLADTELAMLAPELGHEPREAHVSGPTGLECYEQIAATAPAHMLGGAWLLAEIGASQAEAVTHLWRQAGLRDVTVREDHAGLARMVGGRR